MPSVAKGLTLDLALAGSKVGIVDHAAFCGGSGVHSSTHVHRAHINNRGASHGAGSLIYNYKKYDKVANGPETVFDQSRQLQCGGLQQSDFADITSLPKLRYQLGKQALNNNTYGPTGRDPTEAPHEVHYTNRQRALLEHDSYTHDNRTLYEEKISSSFIKPDQKSFNSEEPPQRLSSLTSVSTPVDYQLSISPGKAVIKSRPHSSELEAGQSVGPSGAFVQRHSSETIISCSELLTGNSASAARRSRSLQNHSVPEEDHRGEPETSDQKHTPGTLHWKLSPRIVTPPEDLPARPTTPSPRNDGTYPSSSQILDESLNRDYIDSVAKENAQIKRQVQNSLNRLLKRAVSSAGSVSKAEVDAIQERLQTFVPNWSVAQEERRDSINSQDSGISSDSLPRDANDPDMQQLATAATENPIMEPILKARRKKYSGNKLRQKHKSRSSGKRSRLKARPDSLKKTNDKQEEGMGNAHVPNDSPKAGLMNLQAYCQTMQVLPASLRPKVEKPTLLIPSPPVRSSTTAIYKERLPRVPQPTLTCDGSALKDNNLDIVISTYPPPAKKTLNLTKVTSPRRSFPDPARVYGGGAIEDVIRPTKVYLSERQSGMLNELGIDMPCAPPATPMPDLLKKVEYIPSMFDIRAQRAVKSKLEVLDRQEKKKKEKQQEQQLKKDKVAHKEHIRDSKRQQRLQIYALNKKMTAWENENYLNFCSANGIEPDL